MREVILNFSKQIKTGLEAARDFKLDKRYNRVILCGMGGSIIPADIFVLFAGHNHLETHFEIWKDYDIPTRASKDDLIVCISWSGTTEETISSCQKAVSKDLPIVVITRGGELGAIARQNNLKTIILPQDNIPSRFATGHMIAVLFSIFGYSNELAVELKPESLEDDGKQLALKIGHNIPLLYSSYNWRKPPAFWKILFNENSKVHAFWNTFPALTHNELAGFAGAHKDIYPIIFRESNPDPRIDKNYKATIAILEKLEYNYSIVNLSEELPDHQTENFVKIILNNYLLGLWTSYYLAKNLGADPKDIKLIEDFKQLKKSL